VNCALLDLTYRIIKRTTGQLKINKVKLMKIGFVRKNELSAINSATALLEKKNSVHKLSFSPLNHIEEKVYL